jgi:hypothetical protein
MLLFKSTTAPTHCRKLVAGWLDFVGIKDASIHGAGNVTIGKLSACTPTVFRFAWKNDVQNAPVSQSSPSGTISNLDLEMAGLLMLFVILEKVCGSLVEKHSVLFSDNSPTVGWVDRLASCHSTIAAHLIRALVLWLIVNRCCPLTHMHISGGMSMAMKAKFGFVNITGTTFHNVKEIAVNSEYNTTISVIG